MSSKYSLSCIILLFNFFILTGQSTEYNLKAAYIERFTRFIEWPDQEEDLSSDQTFEIAVVGYNKFGNSLDNLFSEHTIKNLKVRVSYVNSIDDINIPDIVFICQSENREVKDIIDKIRYKPILIISDTKGFAELGVHINMVIEDSHLHYEINNKAIQDSGLKISSLFLASARIID